MKFRGLFAAVVILAGLGGWLWWSQKHPAKPAAEAPATPAIVKVDTHAVSSITITNKGAAPITIMPNGTNGSGAWQITSPDKYRANADAVNAMLKSLSDLHPASVVDEHASTLAPYALSDPAVTVKVDERNGQSASLSVGDKTPTGGGYYATVPGTARVYTVESSVESTLAKSLNDLRDRHLLPVETSAVNNVELTIKGQRIDIARKPGGWQIQQPEAFRTDSYAVDDLLQQLTSATFDPAANSSDAAAQFAHGTPVASVKLTTTSGTDTLEIKKSKNEDFAKSSGTQGVWKVDSGVADSVSRGVDAYRNKQLFDFGFTDPNRIEYHAGATNVVLERKDNDWYSDGKKMDPATVSSVVDALRGLSASKFVASGYNKPEIDITVVSNGGKETAVAHFEKTSNGAIAKRHDSPGLYFFDSAAMDTLYKAIAGLKPASPATKKK